MNYYPLRSFGSRADAEAFAQTLPTEAGAKIVPTNTAPNRGPTLFAVDVIRSFTGGHP